MGTAAKASTGVIRVAAAEDHPVFARGLFELLDEAPDIEVVGMQGDRDSLLALLDHEDVDVVLTDLRMPPGKSDEGLQVARALARRPGDVGVILLTQYVDTAAALELFADGTRRRGYMLKESLGRPDQLQQAVRDVAAGGSVVDPSVVDVLITARGTGHGSPLALLTGRELDVLRLVSEGLANQGISDRLGIGQPAVAKHLTSVFQKLGIREDAAQVNRRVSAALLFLANNQPNSGALGA